MTAASAIAFGFLLGLRHAADADHLAAVTTIVTERSSPRHASLVGALWGLGHGLALLPVALVVIVLRVEIEPRVATLFELGVALMLVVLAVRTLRQLARGFTVHVHPHRHGGRRHVHFHVHDHVDPGDAGAADAAHAHDHRGVRPLLVGMVHGLAGSAALMLLVLSTISEPAVALLYVAVFAVGSTLGMVLVSLAVGLPLHLTDGRFRRLNLALRGAAGCASLGIGVTMIYELAWSAA
jgi:hypothetical protein